MPRATERIEYENDPSQWAELYSRPTADEIKSCSRAIRARLGTEEETEAVFAILDVLIKDWHATDEEGAALPKDRKGLGRADGDFVFAVLFPAAMKIVKGALPNF